MRIVNKNISGDLIYYSKVVDQLLQLSLQQKITVCCNSSVWNIPIFLFTTYLPLLLALNAGLFCVELLKVFIQRTEHKIAS